MSRTDPMSIEQADSTVASPRTHSVDPPPRSTTRYGPGMPRARRPPVAPRNDRVASSSPVTTSGAVPKSANASRTPATNSAALDASRDAEVATNRTVSAPSSRH